MKNIYLFTILFLLACTTTFAQGYKLRPPTAGFKVTLPAALKPESNTETTDDGKPGSPFTTHLFTQREGSNVAMVCWADYEPKFKVNIQTELAANRDNFLKSSGATLRSEKAIKLGGYEGIEFIADITGKAVVRARVYVVGRRPYILVAISGDDPANLVTAKFFDSFQLVKN